eukprot:7534887-Ditylum_brightwellii.AAC.1
MEGHCLFVCRKANIARVVQFIDYTLPMIFQENMSKNKQSPGFLYPARSVSDGNKTVGRYAEVLKKEYTDKSSYPQNIYTQKFDQSPITRPNIRITINTDIEVNPNEGQTNTKNNISANITQESQDIESPKEYAKVQEENKNTAKETKVKLTSLEERIKEQMAQMQVEIREEM